MLETSTLFIDEPLRSSTFVEDIFNKEFENKHITTYTQTIWDGFSITFKKGSENLAQIS